MDTQTTPKNLREEIKQPKIERSAYARMLAELVSNYAAVLGLIIIIAFILFAIFADALTPYDPIQRDARGRLAAPTIEHPFGTDSLGRDVLARVLYGGRVSIVVGFSAIAVAGITGIGLGLIAGYFGGKLDNAIMRVMDVILAFPGLILAIWLVAIFGSSLNNLILAIAFFNIPTFARLSRGSTLSAREMDYVIAARSMGANPFQILWKHILPTVSGPLIVLATLSVSGAIVTGASLSFLGLGVDPPTPEWGAMLADGRSHLRNAWWIAFFPRYSDHASCGRFEFVRGWSTRRS
jgi:peptide/nickel transport system permease protein